MGFGASMTRDKCTDCRGALGWDCHKGTLVYEGSRKILFSGISKGVENK